MGVPVDRDHRCHFRVRRLGCRGGDNCQDLLRDLYYFVPGQPDHRSKTGCLGNLKKGRSMFSALFFYLLVNSRKVTRKASCCTRERYRWVRERWDSHNLCSHKVQAHTRAQEHIRGLVR